MPYTLSFRSKNGYPKGNIFLPVDKYPKDAEEKVKELCKVCEEEDPGSSYSYQWLS